MPPTKVTMNPNANNRLWKRETKLLILFKMSWFIFFLAPGQTAGVTGKGGTWRIKPPDAESTLGAASLQVWAKGGYSSLTT
jgi:hypothetical protein